jgi:hypothetical protein
MNEASNLAERFRHRPVASSRTLERSILPAGSPQGFAQFRAPVAEHRFNALLHRLSRRLNQPTAGGAYAHSAIALAAMDDADRSPAG